MPNRNDHEKFMRRALAKAREGVAKGQTPFGACIVRDGEVIGCAHNRVWETTDITAHAEICAIRDACRHVDSVDLKGSVIYSTCEPCPMCFSACHWAKIETIVFGARIEDARDAGFHELAISNERMQQYGASPVMIIPDFLRDENMDLFAVWFQRGDHKAY